MKIIISPSKTQNKSPDKSLYDQLVLDKKTDKLFTILRNMTRTNLGYALNIKGKLLDLTYYEYQKSNNEKMVYRAIDLYEGVVFEQLGSYINLEKEYQNKNLCILSAMYGVLKPESKVYPYRLDMNAKIPGVNLYSYWESEIDDYFHDEDFIINLASKEFSDMLKKQKVKIINIDFYEEKNHKLKVVSYNAKKMRGKMLDFIIRNKISEIDSIKLFESEGYLFSTELSDEENIKFIKRF